MAFAVCSGFDTGPDPCLIRRGYGVDEKMLVKYTKLLEAKVAWLAVLRTWLLSLSRMAPAGVRMFWMMGMP